ncbi:MAG: tetratricopeptide repeat protein [archaeon]
MKKIILSLLFITLIGLVSAQSAMDFYLEGEDYLLSVTSEDNAKAITAFQEAISIDSEFSHAYAGLSKAYAQKYQYFDKDEQWYNLAIQNAEKAQTIDPLTYDVSETHLALARVYAAKGEDKKAEQEYEQMLSLYPDYKDLYSNLNEVLDEKQPVSLEKKSNIIWIVIIIIIVVIIISIVYFKYKKPNQNTKLKNTLDY